MKIVARRTKHVTSINKSNELIDDTAFMTASGVVKAIEAAVACRLDRADLNDVHIAIQGIGSVGFLITKMLIEKGARITICDKNTSLLEQRAKEVPVTIVNPDEIASVDCDVFSPCALGGVINKAVVENIKAPIICGAANNQLQDISIGDDLLKSKILFIPDYVANAGGVICAAAQAGVITKDDSLQKVNGIYDSVMNIINNSMSLMLPTSLVANNMAEASFL